MRHPLLHTMNSSAFFTLVVPLRSFYCPFEGFPLRILFINVKEKKRTKKSGPKNGARILATHSHAYARVRIRRIQGQYQTKKPSLKRLTGNMLGDALHQNQVIPDRINHLIFPKKYYSD